MRTETSDHERAGYDVSGFVVLDGAVSDETIETLRTALETWPGRDAATGPYGILKNNVWQEIPYVRQLIGAGRLPSLACALLGVPEVILFQDNLVWKPPGGARIEWHQDYSYWPLDRPAGVTLWIAVDDAHVGNGCMHYLPATHTLGERRPADFIAGTGQPAGQPLPPLDVEHRAADAVAAEVRAGGVLAHHPLVWHMSPRNESDRPRRALTVTWIAPDVRWAPDHAPHPYLYALRPRAGEPVAGETFPRFSPATVSDLP